MTSQKNDSFSVIWKELSKCKRVAMSLHARPDGDSLGSCTALKYVLERDLDIKVDLVSYDSLEEELSALPFAKDVRFGVDLTDLNLDSYDAVMFVDSSLKNFSGKLRERFTIPQGIFSIVIDHHSANERFGNLNYVDENAPSACSVLIDLFRANKVMFDHELCLRLLIGLSTDTGFFAYDSSPLRALKEAVFLIECGNVNYYQEITLPIRMSVSLKMKKLHGLIINNLVIDKNLRAGYSIISLSDVAHLGLNASDIRGGIRAIQDLKDVDFTFTLTELSDSIKGSFRSSRNVDVSRFALALGGGGHKPAAAFVLPKMPLEKAINHVLEVIRKVGIHPIH